MAGSEPSTRERTARKVRLATGATAAGAGSVLGGAKLRDSFRADYPHRYHRGVSRLDALVAARRTVEGHQRAARLARVLTQGHPGFVPLAVAAGAGGAAAGAQRYEHHLARRRTVGKSATNPGSTGVHGSAFEPLTKSRHRDRVVTAAAGAGSLAAVRSAGHGRRAARGRLLEAAEHERRSNASFHAAAEGGRMVTQRMARHVDGHLPRTTANLARTGVELGRQQAHVTAGLAAREAAHASTRAATRGLRVSRAKLALAGGLGAVAAAHSRRH